MRPPTHIRITTGTTEVELGGSQDFVEDLLGSLRALGTIPEETGGGASADRGTRLSADDFLQRLHISSGKTAVQDYILAFGYYVTQIHRRTSFTVEDLDFHFAHAAIRAPRNLANALGNLKRKRGLIEPGEQRGTHVLNAEGIRYVESLMRPVHA